MASRNLSERERHARRAALVEWLARDRWNYLAAGARRSGASEPDIADVVQSALVDVLRSFPGPYRRANARAYAYRCVQTQAWNLLRRRVRKDARILPVPGDEVVNERVASERGEPLESAIRAEELTESRGRLAELPEDERTALLLLGAGCDRAHVRSVLGLSERALRKRVERGNRRLRRG